MQGYQILNALVDLGWGHSQRVAPEEIGAESRTLAAVQRALRLDRNRWLIFVHGHVLAAQPGGRFEDTAACGSRTRVTHMYRVERLPSER